MLRMPSVDSRDSMRRSRAENNTPRARLYRQIQQNRELAEEEQRKEETLFRFWAVSDDLLKKVTEQRDVNRPKSIDEPWSDAFCTAIRILPDVRELARDAWLDYACFHRVEQTI